MQLVILNKLDLNPIKDFHIYKYRNEVQVIPFIAEKDTATILAAAYAAIYLPAFLSFLFLMVSGNIPSIDSDNNLFGESLASKYSIGRE